SSDIESGRVGKGAARAVPTRRRTMVGTLHFAHPTGGHMTETVKIISPVDGSVYAERALTTDAALDAALSRARAAQADWARVPVAERVRQVLAMLEAVLAMNDEIVPELAWQMGRPIRFGGEKRGLEERARYMASIAEEALAPLVPNEMAGFRRYVRREAVGLV